MTPTGIRLGRQFDAQTSSLDIGAGQQRRIATADANRVALAVAIQAVDLTAMGQPIPVGPFIGTTVVALTALTGGHPACYLSVDKIGSVLFAEIWLNNTQSDDITVGITIVRQVQELP